ncbi:MAG: ABC transporter substrate-binding protein [Deferribacterales bacterium]|jgi:branched-chain amino acid transport system substrate-binding protein|uniref:ABC transporter substrate-binding protein n=1 Tax=Deferrivibrio essentukiensis TaxID=2880922 RepID=UPI0019AF2CCF|nr:ABC transporter substrate-binding protein [Deferrivibrio essentukiensis]MBC7196364.1 ABC transporter substrate-binding protein [Deferribacterales bacterium]MBZ4672849.1 Extracellular ligand-binding receptor [Deferribacteraceae bacterium]MCB4204089.1 ABC transporter substrate-binding protein [Deferrivibrio essentukiensis]
MKKLLVLFISVFLVSMAYAGKVRVGALVDLTGPTGDVGKPYAEGVRDCVRYFNENGGINGNEVELLMVDYQYKIPQAIAAYKDFLRKKVVAIHGWGTGDTEALSKFITKDKIPYFSASYSEHITDPKNNPYNFLVGATYSDQARIALKFIKDKGEKKTVAFIYNDTGFGRSPFFPDGEEYAKKIGVQLVDKQVVDLKALDATSQLLNLSKAGAEYALVQETYMAASTILKDAKKLGIDTKFIGLNWTFGKTLIDLAKDAAEGYYGTSSFAFWGQTDVEGIKFLHELNKKYHPDVTFREVNYIQGFSSMYVLLSALKMTKGELTGENIKKTLESFKDFSTMGLTAPVTFTKESHKGIKALKIYQIKNSSMIPVTDYITAD